ncbi:hypothetical protein KBY66_02515 [Synechococcus sp. Tobar12-5m-g]|uniref:hypothetical protein n=1 Tax=unclassified Synechococcus TaxID=2626047 RepID=UPI0020CDDC07|nr:MULTISPECIES: hypothetical protein [unclassified Synechococcus]MCP9771507.1 hypothetical protein [Synechococcus sp. Tobar12-5m-g]MCP9872447.1 hypothetical protein [Synechococcus sp. Cruz CV-v-12]
MIGLAEDSSVQTVPISAAQLQDLLNALAAASKHELRLAVALVGLYGIRPAELRVLSIEDASQGN